MVGRSAPLLAGAVFAAAYFEFWRRIGDGLTGPLDQALSQRRYGPQAGWTEDYRCTNPKSGPPFGPLANVHTAMCPSTVTQSMLTWNNNINKYQVVGSYPTGHYRAEVLYDRVTSGSFYIANLGEHWRHPMSGPAGNFNPAVQTPFWRYNPAIWSPPLEIPWVMPLLDPLIVPPGQPVPTPRKSPRARPVRRPNPHRAPRERPETGPRPNPRPRPGQEEGPGTETVYPPVGQGSPQTRPIPGPRPGPGSGPSRRPPRNPKKEKEKKLRTGLPPGIIAKVVNAATETKDVIDALWNALPGWVRANYINAGKHRTPQGRAEAVYKHFGEIDWSKAIANLIENQLEDALAGTGGKLGRRANQARGRFAPDGQSGVGVGTGFF